jgi:hypothetical protein
MAVNKPSRHEVVFPNLLKSSLSEFIYLDRVLERNRSLNSALRRIFSCTSCGRDFHSVPTVLLDSSTVILGAAPISFLFNDHQCPGKFLRASSTFKIVDGI